jgi:hypothetical protein
MDGGNRRRGREPGVPVTGRSVHTPNGLKYFRYFLYSIVIIIF